MHHFIEAQHAAEVAVASMALRALLARARDEEPDVVALRLEATATGTGADIAVELVDAAGNAVGGYSL